MTFQRRHTDRSIGDNEEAILSKDISGLAELSAKNGIPLDRLPLRRTTEDDAKRHKLLEGTRRYIKKLAGLALVDAKDESVVIQELMRKFIIMQRELYDRTIDSNFHKALNFIRLERLLDGQPRLSIPGTNYGNILITADLENHIDVEVRKIRQKYSDVEGVLTTEERGAMCVFPDGTLESPNFSLPSFLNEVLSEAERRVPEKECPAQIFAIVKHLLAEKKEHRTQSPSLGGILITKDGSVINVEARLHNYRTGNTFARKYFIHSNGYVRSDYSQFKDDYPGMNHVDLYDILDEAEKLCKQDVQK